LTTLFNNTGITTVAPIDAPAPRQKSSWLPLLTVLFCLSYGLMTMLIVEQGATIESQRALIRDLYRDSAELSAAKLKAQQDRILAGTQSAQSASPKTQAPVTHNPSSQNPSTQAPAQQAPSSQAAPRHRAQAQTNKQNQQFKMPSRPASDLVDARRALITI
jgi:cell division septation protein DedD